MADWISFWDGSHSIYVSPRHKEVHYRLIAADMLRLIPGPTARVLDYGCGEALAAEAVAQACGQLVLCEAAPALRDRLKARFAGKETISVLSPEEVAALPEGSFDLIVCNSVLQYLTRETLEALLVTWRQLLAKGGSLVIADVIPPHVSAVQDALALLKLGLREGFLLEAVFGLARTTVSSYRKLRAELGLTTYEEREMLSLLEAARLPASRVRPNIGHNQQRMAFKAFRLR